MIEYNIANLFLEGFGLKVGGIYRPEVSSGKADDPNGLFMGLKKTEAINDSFERSGVGTPILYPIRFLENTYKKYNTNGELVDAKMATFRLPIASIISFRRDKIMSTTKINGGRGTVKEIYGFDDWQVTINGFLIPDASQPEGFKNPLDQEKELIKWDNLASSIEVGCELFTTRGIGSLTIKGVSFEPMRGKPNIRTFTISAVSDEPIELNIKSTV
jgi:hypothetical protein